MATNVMGGRPGRARSARGPQQQHTQQQKELLGASLANWTEASAATGANDQDDAAVASADEEGTADEDREAAGASSGMAPATSEDEHADAETQRPPLSPDRHADAVIQEWVEKMRAMAMDAEDATLRREAMDEAGCVPILVGVIRGHAAATTLLAAIDAIWWLTQTESCRKSVQHAGGLQALVGLLKRRSRTDDGKVSESAAQTLGNLASANSANRKALSEAGAIPGLVAALAGGAGSETANLAAVALCNLLAADAPANPTSRSACEAAALPDLILNAPTLLKAHQSRRGKPRPLPAGSSGGSASDGGLASSRVARSQGHPLSRTSHLLRPKSARLLPADHTTEPSPAAAADAIANKLDSATLAAPASWAAPASARHAISPPRAISPPHEGSLALSPPHDGAAHPARAALNSARVAPTSARLTPRSARVASVIWTSGTPGSSRESYRPMSARRKGDRLIRPEGFWLPTRRPSPRSRQPPRSEPPIEAPESVAAAAPAPSDATPPAPPPPQPLTPLQASMQALVHGLRDLLTKDLQRTVHIFFKWDKDHSGKVDRHEFHQAINELGVTVDGAAPPADVIDSAYDAVLDVNGDGKVEYKELHKVLRRLVTDTSAALTGNSSTSVFAAPSAKAEPLVETQPAWDPSPECTGALLQPLGSPTSPHSPILSPSGSARSSARDGPNAREAGPFAAAPQRKISPFAAEAVWTRGTTPRAPISHRFSPCSNEYWCAPSMTRGGFAGGASPVAAESILVTAAPAPPRLQSPASPPRDSPRTRSPPRAPEPPAAPLSPPRLGLATPPSLSAAPAVETAAPPSDRTGGASGRSARTISRVNTARTSSGVNTPRMSERSRSSTASATPFVAERVWPKGLTPRNFSGGKQAQAPTRPRRAF